MAACCSSFRPLKLRGQHRLLGRRVLDHEIIDQSEIHLMCLLVGPVLPLPLLGIPLLLGELQVAHLGGTKHAGALCLMSSLSLLQHLVEVDSLLIVSSTSKHFSLQALTPDRTSLIPPGLSLTQLLVHPLLLLPPLQPLPVPLHCTDLMLSSAPS